MILKCMYFLLHPTVDCWEEMKCLLSLWSSVGFPVFGIQARLTRGLGLVGLGLG